MEVNPDDAAGLQLNEGDLVDVATPRGRVRARARVCGIRPGVLFVPFHYGYWDTDNPAGPEDEGRAANELTLTDWDPASKQPLFKTAAARVTRVAGSDGKPAPAPTTTASRPVSSALPPTRGGANSDVEEVPS